MKCPRCGGELVLKTETWADTDGVEGSKDVYNCSNGSCLYTEDASEDRHPDDGEIED